MWYVVNMLCSYQFILGNVNLALNKPVWLWLGDIQHFAVYTVDGDIGSWAISNFHDWPYMRIDIQFEIIVERVTVLSAYSDGN